MGSREKQNSGDSEMSAIQIRQRQASSAHNVYVAEQRKHEHQMRLNRLHQFIREHMAERDRKTNKSERSIQTFRKDQKKAIFLNYDLRYVSKNQKCSNKIPVSSKSIFKDSFWNQLVKY